MEIEVYKLCLMTTKLCGEMAFASESLILSDVYSNRAAESVSIEHIEYIHIQYRTIEHMDILPRHSYTVGLTKQ